MLQVSLSSLNGQDLRRALEAARSRNQTGLAQDILAEIERRTTAFQQPPEPDFADDDLEMEAADDVTHEDSDAGWTDLPGGRRYVLRRVGRPSECYKLSSPYLLRP
jgi:hypothetical protein